MPAINRGGERHSASKSPIVVQHYVPEQTAKSDGSSRLLQQGSIVKRSQGKKEKELELRRIQLRNQQPDLTKAQSTQYRNTYKHNLCLDMLQDGFHKSYTELFALIKRQNEEREMAGPESVLWNQLLLENEPEKLDTLKTYLSTAEGAFRKDDFGQVYKCQFQLACYFQGTGDKWLADHFFERCLATSTSVTSDGGRTAAEGHCNVGLALEESADFFAAAENYEQFYKLTKDKSDWQFEDGKDMHSESCNHLTRIYTTIAKRHEADGNLELNLSCLNQAHDMAMEGGDNTLKGEAAYRLGVAYEKNGDPQTALLYLNKFLEICRTLNDSKGSGKACQAIAKSYDSQGKVEESIKYLEMFVETAEKSQDDKAVSRACSDLGAMFNSLGRYEQAVEYFNKSYNLSRSLNDVETISSSRVLFGVAAGHKMLQNVCKHIEIGSLACVDRLIEWKDNRGDEFDKPVPQSADESADSAKPSSADSSKKD